MAIEIDFTKVKTSWTKYDIVQVMEVIYDRETLFKFKNKEAKIDEPILKSFLGIKSLDDPIPDYWFKIQSYPLEKGLFAFFSVLFTHGGIVKKFSEEYSLGDMKGLFKMEIGKQYTNIRSALIESGASAPANRRKEEVPFDFTPIFQNRDIGIFFKQVLEERISRLNNAPLSKNDFYEICFANNFHKALSISKPFFKAWLEGDKLLPGSSLIERVTISNFFSIEKVDLTEIRGAKEVYFLGENGDGKSLVLMAIYLAFNKHFIINETDKEKTGKVVDIIESNKEMELNGYDINKKKYGDKNVGYLRNFIAYGTHRGRYSTDKPEEYGFMSLFDSDQTLTNPVSWLKDQKLLEFNEKASSMFSVRNLEKMFHDLLEKNVKISVSGNKVEFIEKGTILSFDQLSEGYKSILIFVSDLLFRLQRIQNEATKVESLSGIVLVDEIDLHLHPKWQIVIVKKLRRLLPNVQFIFTTHSPSVIQGASDDAIIYRVYRNSEDGKTRVSDPYYRKQLNHLMINSLLTSPLFGMENSRLDSENQDADTSESYLLYRVTKKLEEELANQKREGKEFISNDTIDDLIQKIIDEELGK